MRDQTGRFGIGSGCCTAGAGRWACRLGVLLASAPARTGVRAGASAGSDLLDMLVIAATAAVDVSSEPIASAASSSASGGRVERSGGIAGEAILVCEL